jgi:hypothetical protein
MRQRIILKIYLFFLIFNTLVFSVVLFPGKVLAQEASFYVSPETGTFKIGQNFSVSVLINTEGSAINAAQAILYFPTDKIKAVDISKTGSIFSLWTQEPTWSNTQGTVSFGGGLPSPGFRGQAGKVITITFQGKSSGEAKVYFGGEAILANDQWGTDVFSTSSGGTYTIGSTKVIPLPQSSKVPATPEITSPTHPDPEKWYNDNNPKFQWDLGSDISAVSFALNQEPVFDPGPSSEKPIDSKLFTAQEDGVWYFHLKLKNTFGWSGVGNFKVQIDTQVPHPFEIKIDNEGDPTNPSPLLFFKAEDDTSGINHYEVQIDQKDVFNLTESQTNPYRLSPQYPGLHLLKVVAVDYAENKTQATLEIKIESIPVPQITVCPSDFISGEEVLHLEGTALPDSTVLIFFKKNDEVIKQEEANSNGEGLWTLNEESVLRSGLYRISARTRDSRGAISNPSEDCEVKVAVSGIAIGPWIISYFWGLMILVIILLVLLALLFYLVRRIFKAREKIEIETKDLKIKFYKEYYELQRDIMDQLERYRKVRAERDLSGEEKEAEMRLLSDLADVERVLREELRDIEEIK